MAALDPVVIISAVEHLSARSWRSERALRSCSALSAYVPWSVQDPVQFRDEVFFGCVLSAGLASPRARPRLPRLPASPAQSRSTSVRSGMKAAMLAHIC